MSEPSPARRVLVIGLDGATFDVIRPLISQGRLPTLARLMQQGTHAPLRSTIQPSSEQAWVSFMTGVQNGKHGIFSFVRRKPNSYEFEYVSGGHIRAPALWDILTERSRPTITINVPMTYPPHVVNGVLVGGLMSPGERSRFTYPDGLYDELCREIGGYIIDVDVERGDLTPDEEERLLGQVAEMTRLRTAATLYLARTRAWDLLTVVYGSPDRVSHKFWKYMDPTHPLYTAEGAARFGQVIPQVYEAMDAAVAELLAELADERTSVLILSDHGFGPTRKAVYLNKWLAQHGYLAYQPVTTSPRRRAQAAFAQGVRKTMRRLDNPVLSALKAAAFARFPGFKSGLFSSMSYAQVDWSRTQAYAVGTMGNIYLNVAGREPAGIVEPGAEYEEVRARLIADLAALTDDDTGEPVFQAVYRREELYEGPCQGDAPDVVCLKDARYHVAVVDWRTQPDDRVLMPLLPGELLFAADLSAQHQLDGIFIAQGPGIPAGQPLTGPRIIDLAPTILHLLGEPAPADMDGVALFGEGARTAPARGETAAPAATPPADGEYTDEEQTALEAHLRSLGYLD